MSCIRPLKLYNCWYHPTYNAKNFYTHEEKETILVPCNHCIGCLIAKQQALEFLCNRQLITEYQKGSSASFITLTYSDANLPKNKYGFQTLSKKDAQDFHKRLRILLERHGVLKKYKYVLCGEYGDGSHATDTKETTHRPHIHMALFGYSKAEISPFIMKAWQRKGIIDIGPLTQGGLRYIISYMEKQHCSPEVKPYYEILDVEPPFLTHSIGIGKEWIINNLDRIVENKGTFNLNGKIELFPRYILDFVTNHYGIDTRYWIKDFFYSQSINRKTPFKSIAIKEYLDLSSEKQYIKLQHKILALQSKNKPVSSKDLEKAYIRPVSSRIYVKRKNEEIKNQINQLVKEALA